MGGRQLLLFDHLIWNNFVIMDGLLQEFMLESRATI